MSASSAGKLYTPELLSLATELASYPLTGEWDYAAEARSSTCGSSIMLGIVADASNRIDRLGLRVSACAIGQAAAAIFARSSAGRTEDDLAGTLGEISAWLAADTAPVPTWPGFAALVAARDYPGRHGALILPWRAAALALSKGDANG
jgi:NifU-like protein involved in Fe-S cluster formation